LEAGQIVRPFDGRRGQKQGYPFHGIKKTFGELTTEDFANQVSGSREIQS